MLEHLTKGDALKIIKGFEKQISLNMEGGGRISIEGIQSDSAKDVLSASVKAISEFAHAFKTKKTDDKSITLSFDDSNLDFAVAIKKEGLNFSGANRVQIRNFAINK